MSGNDLMILDIVRSLERTAGKAPCKKTLQKIVYLLEEAGVGPEFNYTIHFYGPYSADLDYEVQSLASQGMLNINYTDYGHLISVNDEGEKEGSILSRNGKEIVSNFGIETPSKLELIATTLFVQRAKKSTDADQILPGVKKIKGSKYSDREIRDAIDELHSQNYF
ncbi:hypothetical protein [Flavonifractor sp. An112]|uniref:hypothetical protein n=1 Tax=Flavonifractor sp. An112 TaxID=1965544 RepID=UPI00174944EE|nr:hypothetical protein [Flavonifractor sp. An112]